MSVCLHAIYAPSLMIGLVKPGGHANGDPGFTLHPVLQLVVVLLVLVLAVAVSQQRQEQRQQTQPQQQRSFRER